MRVTADAEAPRADRPKAVAARAPGPEAADPAGGAGARAAALPLALVGALIVWWAWKSGAYFDVVALPGTIALLALLAALLLYAPWPGRLAGPARVALLALFGLAAWTAVSALWSPAPAIAIADAQRVIAYGVAFALGIWLCLLLGRRMLLALAPVAAAAAIVAVATLLALWLGDAATKFFEEDATLRYPLGYRNAVAAFFLIGFFPMLVLAASAELDWRPRGALLGAATLSIELAVLSQSRGAVFAIAGALAVLLAVHPARLRILAYLAIAAIPAAVSLPWLLDVYQGEGGATAASIPLLHAACRAMAVSSLLAAAAGLLLARAEPSPSERTRRIAERGLIGLAALLVVLAVVGVARLEGGPVGFVQDRIDDLSAGTPDLSSEGSRFGVDLRTGRGDIWRVAIEDVKADPWAGEGSGGFRRTYLLERESDATAVQPEDPHSVELLMLSELGILGLLLFAAFAVCSVWAILRARRLGPAAALLAAGALGAGAYWLLHASVEWFWHYPAITLPVCFLLGAAGAPALLAAPADGSALRRRAGAALAILVALSLLPFFLSERYTRQALREARSDLARAYADSDRAADLNPLSERPLAAQAVIAEGAGEPQRALAALARAQRRNPTEWTLYFLEARALERTDPAAARRALARARALNPQGTELDALEARLGAGG